MTEDEKRVEKDLADEFATPDWAITPVGEPYDPFADDEPLACGVENPEACESCQ